MASLACFYLLTLLLINTCDVEAFFKSSTTEGELRFVFNGNLRYKLIIQHNSMFNVIKFEQGINIPELVINAYLGDNVLLKWRVLEPVDMVTIFKNDTKIPKKLETFFLEVDEPEMNGTLIGDRSYNTIALNLSNITVANAGLYFVKLFKNGSSYRQILSNQTTDSVYAYSRILLIQGTDIVY